VYTSFSLPSSSQPLISACGNFDNNIAELFPGDTPGCYNATNTPEYGACHLELIIFAHQTWAASENACEEFDRTAVSTEKIATRITLVF
jgi:hypothetical protein